MNAVKWQDISFMHIDIFSAIVFNIISSFLMGLILLFVASGYLGEIKGVKHWAVGLLFQSLGWLLYIVIKVLPAFAILIPIATSSLITGAVFYFHSLVEFKEVKVSVRPLHYVAFLSFLLLIYFNVISESISIRIVIGAFAGYLVAISTSYLLLSKRFRNDSTLSKSHLVTGCIFVFCTGILGFRTFYFSLFPAKSIFISDYLQDLTYVLFHLVISLTSFSFLLMCSEKYAAMRTKIEKNLKQSQEHFKDLFENAPLPYQSLDINGNFLAVNQAWLDLVGCSRNEVIGRFFGDFMSESSKEMLTDTFSLFKKQGSITSPMFELITRDTGESRLIVVYGRVARDENGVFQRTHCLLRDITEQHRAVQALRENENRFRTMLDISPMPLGIHDENQNIILLNRVFVETFGYDTVDIPTFLNWWEKSYPDRNYRARIISKWTAMLQTAQENQSAYSPPIEMVVCCKNGTQKTVLASASTFSQLPEKLYLFAFQDITQIKQNEMALMESEFRWKFAIEGSGDGLWDWNLATNKVYFTKRWKEMLGFEVHEIGDDLSEWESRIHPDDKEYTLATVQAYFDLKIPVYVCEHRVRCKDGSYKWILDRGIVVQRDAKGNPLRMIGTHTDISSQKQTEEKLQQLVEQERQSRLEQSQFMAMLAHELKTPLSVIYMTLGMSDLGSETRLHCNRAIADINNVIERCLLSEKIADQQLTVKFSTCNLRSLLEQLKNQSQDPKRLKVELEADFILHNDNQLLNTILFNLIDNAFKYGQKNSLIEISANAKNAGVLITVKNRVGAAGFPEQEKVFEKYYRSKTAHSQTGSGLGLYLVKSIANLICGNVVYKQSETHVMFELWLPFQPT